MRTFSLPDQTNEAGKALFTDGENVYWDSVGGFGDQTSIQFQDDGVNLGGAGTVNTVNFTGTGVAASRIGNTVTVNIDAATPAGLDTQIQYNNGGAFGASSDFTWNNTNKIFTVANGGSALLSINGTTRTYAMGDIATVNGGCTISIDDGNKIIQLITDIMGTTQSVTLDTSTNMITLESGSANPAILQVSNATNVINLSPRGEMIFSFTDSHFDILPNAGGAVTSEIRFYELTANGTDYVGFKAPNDVGKLKMYTLPSVEPTDGQILSTLADGTMSWINPPTGTVTSIDMTVSAIPDTNITVSGVPIVSSGVIALNIPDASTSNRGALTAADYTTFSAKIGGVGTAGQSAYFNGSSTITSDANYKWDTIGIILNIGNGSPFTNTRLHTGGTVNSYIQNNIRNLSNGSSASSDWVATADNGSDTTHYIDLGINGSGGGSAPFTGANLSYLYAVEDGIAIGALGSRPITFYTNGGTVAPVQRMEIDGSASTVTIGTAGGTLGTLKLTGNTSGTVGITVQAAAGTWTLTLPAVAGTANQMLGQNSGATALEWKTFATGTSGTDFAIAHTANTVTFNIPDASPTARGLVTTGSQTFAGTKTFNGAVVLAAGTSSLAALTFPTGAVLTGATAGVWEYDGKVFYSTPVASARGVSPSMQFTILSSPFTLQNANGVQSAFGTSQDVFTLAASTTYFFEGVYMLSTGTTSHSLGMAFALGGGASVTSIHYVATGWKGTANNNQTAQATAFVDQVSSTVILGAAAASDGAIYFRGTIRMNAGGTVTPQIAFSADPTGTCQMLTDSYIRFIPIGDNNVTLVGNVA